MDNLKPCPFCGGEVALEWWDKEEQCIREYEECDGNVPVYLHCHECDTEIYINAAFTPEQAIGAWNKRAPSWIPCSERLPEDYGEYLVLIDGTIVQTLFEPDCGECGEFGFWHDYYDPDTLGFVDVEWTKYEDISHWMPLPEPPEDAV